MFAARVGGASGEVAFDFLTATLPGVVLRALVAGATTFATPVSYTHLTLPTTPYV